MTGITVELTGMDEVMLALSQRIAAIDGATVGGLLAGGLIVQREAQEHVPVEYGNLRASAYTRKTPENEHIVEVGFTADYALWVHEAIEKHQGMPRRSGLGVLWGPHGEPKYLENAARNKTEEVISQIRGRVTTATETGRSE